MQQSVGFGHIPEISARGDFRSLHMMECVVPYPVAAAAHLFQQMRIAPGIVGHHKESGLYAVAVKQIEHPWSDFRHRAIVECKVNRLASALHRAGRDIPDTEYPARHKHSEKQRRTLYPTHLNISG